MAIDKIPAFLGLTQGISSTGGVNRTEYTPPIDTEGASGTNPFGGNLVGINSNIGIGDTQDGQTQAGRKLGGKTLAFA